jgi:hypothetical protein
LERRFIFVLIALASCTRIFQSSEDDPVIARAEDKYLKKSEITAKIPAGLGERDSLTLAQNYINKWIQNAVLTTNAGENLSSSEQDFTQQLEDYRNSLLLYALDQKLVQLYLDTLVTDAEVDAYYQNNHSQFELKGNILKFDFIKLKKHSRYASEFRRLLKASDYQSRERLMAYAEKNATDYWFPTEWIPLNQLLNEMPLEVENQEIFLRRTTFAETDDSLYTYMLRVNDYRTTDSLSPLEFERDKIRNIIINARKISMLDKKRQEIIDEAFKKGDAEIY